MNSTPRILRRETNLPFLVQTRDPFEENYLYPFVHLFVTLSMVISSSSPTTDLFDYSRNRVIKEYPVMPGGDKRSYPCTGSSVLLPLRLTGVANATDSPVTEVCICGGAPPGAYLKANKEHIFLEASRTCRRLRVSDPEPE